MVCDLCEKCMVFESDGVLFCGVSGVEYENECYDDYFEVLDDDGCDYGDIDYMED